MRESAAEAERGVVGTCDVDYIDDLGERARIAGHYLRGAQYVGDLGRRYARVANRPWLELPSDPGRNE